MNLRAIRLLLIALIAAEAALWFFGPQPKDHLLDINAASAAGKRPDWWDDAAIGIHYAAGIAGMGLLIMLATSPWWSRSLGGLSNLKSQISNPKFFWPLLLFAALTCFCLRLPLASKSLWWDEAWVIEQVSLGRWKPDSKQPDKLKFQAHDWSRCVWYYQKPTNHAPMSLLQKASIAVWQKFTHAKKDQFSDLAARAPALIASCIAVLLLGLLLKEWGSPGAGIAAAFVLAVHPWHVRYGVDARAYALVVPLCISGMFAITRIVQTRGVNFLPWLAWGGTEFLWLWAYPNALLDIAALNLVAAVLLWKNQTVTKDRWTALFRLSATNVFAAICFIQVFLPNLIQARHWAGQESDKHVLDSPLAATTLSQLLVGRDYSLSVNPIFFIGAALLLLCTAYAVIILKKGPSREPSIVLAGLLISSLAFALTTLAFGSYFYSRFIIALLPVAIAAVCLALSQIRWRIPFTIAAAGSFLALCAAPLHLYLTRPYAPLHEVTSFVQSDGVQPSKPPLVACYGLGREVLPVYYPSCIPVENAVGLTQTMERAKSEQRPLYLIYGYDNFNRSKLADGFKLLDDAALFTPVKDFPGIESEFTFHVLRAR